MVVVPSASPVLTLQDLIRLVKEKPGQYSFGSSGSGSLHHLSGEMLKRIAGIDLIHVPFKGGGPAVVAVAAGEVTFMFASMPSATPLIQAKRLRPLAVTSPKRLAVLPDVPTLAEAGLKLPVGVEIREWYGVLAPARTPRAVVDKLNAEMVKIFRKPEVQARLSEMGAESAGSSPKELAAQIASDVKTWAKVVGEVGIRVD